MSGVEKWTCSCSHKEIGTIYFLRGAWGAIYGTSLLGVTSCFTDSNSSPKRKIWSGEGIINKRPTLQIPEPTPLLDGSLKQEVPQYVAQNHKFYLDPPQTEPLDLSSKFKPASWYTTDSSGQSVRVCIDSKGGGSVPSAPRRIIFLMVQLGGLIILGLLQLMIPEPLIIPSPKKSH